MGEVLCDLIIGDWIGHGDKSLSIVLFREFSPGLVQVRRADS